MSISIPNVFLIFDKFGLPRKSVSSLKASYIPLES
jgi:hypothetical protein